jgi:predicted outer membrane repeat protein
MGWNAGLPGKVGFLLIILANYFASCQSHSVINLESGAPRFSNDSLEYHLCYASDQLKHNTEMILSPGMHFIDQGNPCIIQNINNLVIRGVGDTGTIEIQCLSNFIGRNFIFLNITNLRIENVIIINCGRMIPDDLPSYVNGTNVYFGAGQKAVLLLSHVLNLVLQDVVFDHCFGFGIIGINLDGDTVLHRAVVTNTNNFEHPLCTELPLDLSCSGSGAVFIYSDPTEGEVSLSNSSLNVINCTFEQNENQIPSVHYVKIYSSARSSSKTERLVLSGGTGLGFYANQRSYLVNLRISGSNFIYNKGYSGALVMVVYNIIREVSIHVDECDFIGNIGGIESRGGGMILLQVNYIDALHTYPTYPNDVYEILRVTRSSFINNEASNGGAVYIHPSPQNASDLRVVFDSDTFIGNIAMHGSAFSSVTMQSTFVPRSLHISLEDIEAKYNTFPSVLQTTTSTVDDSAIFLFAIVQNVTFSGRESTSGSRFHNNNPGIILASGSNVYLKGKLEFYNNTAFNGGAIAMVDFSILFIYEGSRIHFAHNRVISRGGAIYADSLGTLDSCAIQFIGPNRISTAEEIPRLKLNITFEENVARDAGNSIYANPIYNCGYVPEASIFQSTFIATTEPIYMSIFQFTSSVDNGIQKFSSRPERLCFCNDTEFRAEFCGGDLRTARSVIPGEMFTMYLIPVDKINNPVSSIQFAQFSTPELQLLSSQAIRQLSGQKCELVTFQVHGPENGNGDLNLYADIGELAIIVNITLKSCPPGFSIGSQEGLLKCLCDTYVTNTLSTFCNSSSYTVMRPGNSWIGATEHTNASDVLYVPTCPIGHCSEDLTNVDLRIPDMICEPGRSGILCGACKAGLSIVFGSNDCHECSNYWIFTIFTYAVLGILLVVILFILNLTVTQGTVVGLIFYANIVGINSHIFNLSKTQNFMFVFISVINLELGFPVCFFDGMTEVIKVGFQFIFPTYLLLLTVGIIYLIRWSSRIGKLTACNGLHVLATLFYLIYSKIIRTILDSFSLATLRSEVEDRVIWLSDGNLDYFTGSHIALVMVAAIAWLFFIVPYTIMLLFIKQFQRYGTLRLKPILDAYGGPYKDRYTFWVGLRLLALTVVSSTYAVLGTDHPSLALTIQLIFISLFLLWQASTKPFKNYLIELLDIFFTVNFIMMAVVSLHLLNVKDLAIASHRQKQLVEVLTSFAFITFCGIIAFHTLKAFHRIPKIGDKMDRIFMQLSNRISSHSKTNFIIHKIEAVTNSMIDDGSIEVRGVKNEHWMGEASQTTVSLETAECMSDTNDTEIRTRELTETDFSRLREPSLDALF